MVKFLVKWWFVLLLALGALLVWVQPDWLAWTRWVPSNFTVMPLLFLASWGLESRSLLLALGRPGPALWGLAISYGLLPPLAWCFGLLLAGDEVRVGLLISASVPCTLASAVIWTRMAGGSEAEALLIIFLSTLTSRLATPFWLAWLLETQVSFDMSGMMTSLALVVIVPVALGQLLRTVPALARTANQLKTPNAVLCRLLIFVMILKALLLMGDKLRQGGEGLGWWSLINTAGLCLSVHLLGLAAGFWSSRLLGFDRASQIAVAISGSQKTLPVSLYLLETYFVSQPLAVIPVVFYHVGQLVADTFIADAWATEGSSDAKFETPKQM